MFLGLPFGDASTLQQVVLVLNTLVLVGGLLALELLYADAPQERRRQLRNFYPIIIVLGGILAIAVYQQVGV